MYKHWLSIQECPENIGCDLAIVHTTLHCAHEKVMVGKVTRNKLIYAEKRERLLASWSR